MKKVGVLTFHNTVNYGAMYQAFALQKVLNEFSISEIIDYNSSILKQRYDINPFNSKNLKQFLKKTINYSENKKNLYNFKKFREQYIPVSKKEYNENNINDADKDYDLFIAGSDQIWNFKLTNYDTNYFMLFTQNEKKRNSYAASFGSATIDENDLKLLKKYIDKQNYISVRENQGIKIINDLNLNKNVNINVDPVFLLRKNDWLKIKGKNNLKEKYILIYEVAYVEGLVEFARKVAEKNNCILYYISASNKKIKNAKNLTSITPNEFLNYIYNAESIVTSSFHGMAMSIIFEKDFYYGVPNTNNNFGSRLENLSDLLDLEDRNFRVVSFENKCKINYSKINDIIDAERKKSLDYLQEVLK